MAARAGGEVGKLSKALRAEIEEVMAWGQFVKFEGRMNFGDAGAVFLAEKLRGNTIVEILQLQLCDISAVGARALAEALGEDNITLNCLSFYGNPYSGDDGAEAMALMLRKNTTLDFLKLSLCGMGDRGACALGEALKVNATLKSLHLSTNHFGNDGANALAEALRWNESLEQIDLGDCQLTDAGAWSLLATLRENNSTLTKLMLGSLLRINYGIEDSIKFLLEENRAATAKSERRARYLLFCCLMLAPTAHEHVVPSIGAVPVPVMQHAVEHAGKLHVAKRFEVEN